MTLRAQLANWLDPSRLTTLFTIVGDYLEQASTIDWSVDAPRTACMLNGHANYSFQIDLYYSSSSAHPWDAETCGSYRLSESRALCESVGCTWGYNYEQCSQYGYSRDECGALLPTQCSRTPSDRWEPVCQRGTCRRHAHRLALRRP